MKLILILYETNFILCMEGNCNDVLCLNPATLRSVWQRT